jgi:hypothetical protein
MDHVRPDLELDMHVLARRPGGQLQGVGQQDLGSSHMDEQRRQVAQIGMDRRCERLAGIRAVQIKAGEGPDAFLLDGSIMAWVS